MMASSAVIARLSGTEGTNYICKAPMSFRSTDVVPFKDARSIDSAEPLTGPALENSSRTGQPSLRLDLLNKLENLRCTPKDERWPEADWPDEKAFSDARTFIEKLPQARIPAPNIGLANDGEVNFLWKTDGVHIDLGFYGTGTFSFFARDGHGVEFLKDDVPVSGELPNEIRTILGA